MYYTTKAKLQITQTPTAERYFEKDSPLHSRCYYPYRPGLRHHRFQVPSHPQAHHCHPGRREIAWPREKGHDMLIWKSLMHHSPLHLSQVLRLVEPSRFRYTAESEKAENTWPLHQRNSTLVQHVKRYRQLIIIYRIACSESIVSHEISPQV